MNEDSRLWKVIVNVLSVYLMTVMCAAAYYNWRYAKENGFLQWMLFGEIVPSAKALVWPYFAMRSAHPSPADVETAQYFVGIFEATQEFQKREESLASESARIAQIFDAREKTDPDGARMFLADSTEVLIAGIQPILTKIEGIKAPDKLREHYALVLDCPKSQIQAITNMAIALRRKDAPAYASETERFHSSLQACSGNSFWDRVHTSLEHAGFRSADDIDRAVEKGTPNTR